MAKRKGGMTIVVVALVWILLLGGVGAVYKFVVRPFFDDELTNSTASSSQYSETIHLALDSFSGYSVLRSDTFAQELKRAGIRLSLRDDGAAYTERMESLDDGTNQMAVFTIDSFLAAGAELGRFPATIALIIDETQGADAVVAFPEGLKTLQDLDDPDARIVMTPDSPSEFLARVILAQFSLPSLPGNWSVPKEGAGRVFQTMAAADKSEKRAYVLWEPYVSRAVNELQAKVLLDSKQLKGYIVDVLVVERTFLRDHSDTVERFVEAYLRALYSYENRDGAMAELVRKDAAATGGERLDAALSESVTNGIQWKNTLENFGHFGLVPRDQALGLAHIEDMIDNIADVLVRTDALSANPVGNNANTIFFDGVLRQLQAKGFHPSQRVNIVEGVDTPDLDPIAASAELPALTPAQWDAIVPVGELQIKPIAFGRGNAELNVQSRRELEALARRLESFPTYYVVVVGHARQEGDAEANRQLAQDRADAAVEALRGAGVAPKRLFGKTGPAAQKGGAAQSVSFIVGTQPY